MENQSTASRRGVEEVSDCDYEEYSSVERDLRTKQHRSAATSHTSLHIFPGVDENTKVQLAKRASQATSPGVVAENYVNSHHSKPSHEQLEEIGNLRREHKIRAARSDSGESLHDSIDVDEEQPPDGFQERMHYFRKKEDHETMTEDERQKKRRRIKWFLVVMILVTAIVGAGIGVAIGLNGSSSQEVEEPDKTKALHECYMARNDTSDRFYQLSNVVTSDASLVDATGSNQRAALCWLSEVDSWKVDIGNGTEYEVIQRFSLVTVYYHFVGTTPETGSQGLVVSNWLDGVHVCEWDFVSCEEPTNRVTGLFLEGMCLYMPIPEEVALLSDLVNLTMTRCRLTGPIPFSISVLSRLKALDLVFNKLTGTIPSELGGLSELSTLAVAGNNIGGKIPTQLFLIPELNDLNFAGNQITGTLPSNLGDATGLQMIWGYENRLTGAIPHISRLTNLQYLELGKNELHGSFPDISRLTKLEMAESVDLSFNDITGTIPSSIWFFPNLSTISLLGNSVSGTIPAAIGILTTLQPTEELRLERTNIARSIPTTIGNVSDLRILDLDTQGLTGTVPTEMARLSQLEQLYLPSYSNLSRGIPDEVCNLHSPPDTGSDDSTLHCD